MNGSWLEFVMGIRDGGSPGVLCLKYTPESEDSCMIVDWEGRAWDILDDTKERKEQINDKRCDVTGEFG